MTTYLNGRQSALVLFTVWAISNCGCGPSSATNDPTDTKGEFGSELPTGPGPLAVVGQSAAPTSVAELVRQNFAGRQPAKERAEKPSPGRLALDWVQQPDQAPELVAVSQKWFLGGNVSWLAVSANAEFLVAAKADGDFRVWRLKDGEQTGRLSQKDLLMSTSGAISADGKLVAIAHRSGGITIWETESGKTTSHPVEGKTTDIRFAQDGRTVHAFEKKDITLAQVEIGPDGTVRRTALPGRPNRAILTPSGELAVYLEGVRGVVRRVHPKGGDETVAIDSGDLPDEPHLVAASDRFWAVAMRKRIRILPIQMKPGGLRYSEVSLASPDTEKLLFSTNGQWLIASNSRSEVEFWNIIDTSLGSLATIGVDPRLVSVSADGTTFVVLEQTSSQLSVWRVKQWPERGKWRLTQLVFEALHQENYDLLEDLFRQLGNDSESFPWASQISKVGYLIELCLEPQFMDEDEQWRERVLGRWRRKRPDSIAARLVQVWQLVKAGWEARGADFSNTVTAQSWVTFQDRMSDARIILLPLLDKTDVPLEAYFQLLEIAKAEQWPEEQVQPYVEELLRREPAYFRAHVARVEMLMPRWGGEDADSESYARKIADQVGGERGDILYARMASGLQCYYPGKTFFEDTLFDKERVFRGLTLLSGRSHPDWNAANVGMFFAICLEDKERAQPFAKILMQTKDPVWHRRCWKHEYAYEAALRWAITPAEESTPEEIQAKIPETGRK